MVTLLFSDLLLHPDYGSVYLEETPTLFHKETLSESEVFLSEMNIVTLKMFIQSLYVIRAKS